MKLPTRRRMTIKERVLTLWFPSRCVCCGRVVAPRRMFCKRCERTLPQEPRLRHLTDHVKLTVYSPFVYRGGVRRTLHAFKFEGERALGAPLGQVMAAALPAQLHVDVVTFVPMTPDHQYDRGYNQSELLARAVARELDCPCAPLLRKVRQTATQHDLTRAERLTNPIGAYRADHAADKKILLIDDIVTTGSTLSECAHELIRSGAKSVVALCAADAERKD